MSIVIIYAFLVVTVYITNTAGLNNVVRASNQIYGQSSNDASESSPKVSAVLLECPKELSNSQQQKPHRPCEQQLMVNIRVNPSFHVEKCEKFLILDEVYDPRKRAKAKIMSPYLIEISRGEPVMMYPLEFTRTIKSDDFTPQSEKLNCQNFMGQKKGNSGIGMANNTETLMCKTANLSSAESDPEQDSLNRVMDKITDAFAAAKSSVVNEDAEVPFYKSVSQSKLAPENLYNEYITNNDIIRKVAPYHQSNDFNKRLTSISSLGENNDASLKLHGNRHYAQEIRKRQDIKNPSARGGQKQSVGNVGVPEKLFKKLESSDEPISGAEVSMKSRNSGHQRLLQVKEAINENGDARIIDYTLTPIYSRDFNQQQAEIHDEMDDDKDELSSGGYMGRSAAPKAKKFRKFKGGKKRGKKKEKEKRPRQNILHQKRCQQQMDDDEVDYEEHANKQSNRQQEQKNIIGEYQNSDDSNSVKDQDSPGEFEKDEPSFVKAQIPSDMLENIVKNNVFSSGDSQQFPEEDEDENYLEWGQKKGVPVSEGKDYSRHNRGYESDSMPIQEVVINKRKYEEENNYENSKANKLMNPDTQIEFERTQVNINENANYKPLEMPQYDYDEDNKQIVLIHNNNKGHNRKNNMAYASSKNLNFGETNLNSFGKKSAQLHKTSSKEGSNLNVLRSSHKIVEEKQKNFEAAHKKNLINVLSKGKKDFQKIIINSNKLRTGSNLENNKNKYNENGYNDDNEQNDRKINYQLAPGTKHEFFSPNSNKVDSPGISEHRFKPSWRKNCENDAKTNNKPALDPANIGVNFDVDEIIRQNYKVTSDKMPSTETQTRLLLNSEPPQFLPNRPPYSRIIDDPNLNIKDKLGVLDIIDTKNENADNVQNEIYNDILNSYVILATPSPSPIETLTISPKMISIRKTADNSKKKRSFIFYDDLEMRDTLMDNDYNFDDVDQRRRSRDREQSHVQEDVSPCATCGGKGKKPIQKNPSFNPQENTCRCRNQRTICTCPVSRVCTCPDSRKKIRSVSDAWYAVFNMSAPLPFLTTKLRIFRKRHNTWWKIVPSITLSSLSGIFANANLSILFSSHVDIFQLEKSLRLQNHQLLIPKDDRPIRQNIHINHEIHNETPNLNSLNINPSNILAIENPKISNWNHLPIASYSQEEEEEAEMVPFEENNKHRFSRFIETLGCEPKLQNDIQNNNPVYRVCNGITPVRTIAELGYFPTTMNLLEYCPNDKNRLCLNMLEDRVPAYSIKVKLPFRENALIHRHIYKVSISRIVTDATTMNVLQVSVDVINKGLFAHDFAICVCNCPMANGGPKNRVKKKLLPYVGETVTFLLPLILDASNKHKKFSCDVIIREAGCKDKGNKYKSLINHKSSTRSSKQKSSLYEEKDKIVSVRAMAVEPEFRCFCIWDCKCHCVPKLETYVDCHVCHKMYEKDSVKAGLISCEAEEEVCAKKFDDDDEESAYGGKFNWFVHNALVLLGIMLALGLLKAVIGLFSKKVNRCCYEYVQPTSNYEDSSKCRRFLVNILFFIVFPFLFWCKCFTPSEEDLLVASTEWQCSLVQDSRRSSEDDDYENCGYKVGKFSDEEEDVILSQHFDKKKPKSGCRSSGGEDILNMDTHIKDWTLAFNEGVFDDEDDADEEANTKFVLQALVESRESLKKLLRNPAPHKLDVVSEEVDPRIKRAEEFVQSLKTARIVYRAFDRPVGNVRNIPFGFRYCVQGFFLPSLGSEFEFVNYNPMAQYRCISADGTTLEILRPPISLCPQEFSRVYADPVDVLEAGDLFISPPSLAPCINITTMAAVASSVVKLASDHSCNGNSSPSSQVRRGKQCNTFYANPPQAYRISTGEDNPSDVDMPSVSQVALNISNMNEEMMNESMQHPIEDESIDLVDDGSIGFTSHHCDTIEE